VETWDAVITFADSIEFPPKLNTLLVNYHYLNSMFFFRANFIGVPGAKALANALIHNPEIEWLCIG
jgi:hypothetical protein